MPADLTTLCVLPDISIRDAIGQMDSNRSGIVLIVDVKRELLGTITDGDVRRAVLADIDLDSPVHVLLAQKHDSPYAEPITAPADAERSLLLGLLQQHSISHIPLLDQTKKVVGLATRDEFLPNEDSSVQAVIMAGGIGSRLSPLTDTIPKSMLPVGDRPMMERIVEQLRDTGIKHVNLAVHHQSERIAEHFGDGQDFGIEISYVTEDRPLGTAGALGLMRPPEDTVLVINGDILTQIDFRAMLAYHKEQKAELTIAVRNYAIQIPYGVVETEGTSVEGLVEKPLFQKLINAGIYLLEPYVFQFIPNYERCDMTDLIQSVLNEGKSVAAFPIHEKWMDIGEHSEYLQAQEYVKTMETKP